MDVSRRKGRNLGENPAPVTLAFIPQIKSLSLFSWLRPCIALGRAIPYMSYCRVLKLKLNSVALSASELYRERDRRLSVELMPTFEDGGVSRGQRGGSIQPYSRFSRPEQILSLPSSSSIVLTRLSGPRSRPITSRKIW
jgi:hypothetical protein